MWQNRIHFNGVLSSFDQRIVILALAIGANERSKSMHSWWSRQQSTPKVKVITDKDDDSDLKVKVMADKKGESDLKVKVMTDKEGESDLKVKVMPDKEWEWF